MKTSKTFQTRCLKALLGLISAASCTQAAVLYDSGTTTFAPTGTQFGRLFRDGAVSDWSAQKAFPGVSGAPAARAFQLIVVNSGQFGYVQINFDDPFSLFFDPAYTIAYTPVNSGPNYGLNVNYKGDPGASGQVFGNPNFYQIVVAPNTNVLIVVNEVTAGAGAGGTFNLLVEGFFNVDYVDTPEPTSISLFLGGGAILIALRKKFGTQA